MTEQGERQLAEFLRLAEQEESPKTEKQKRILEAAVDIFAEKGFAASSTSEIAQKAGVAEGTIFRHYKTKKDLLLAIASPIAFKLAAPFILREFALKVLDAPHERVEELLRAVVKDRLQFARQHIKLLQILLHEIPYQPELLSQVQTLFKDIVYRRVEKMVVHYQKQGQIIEAPPWRVLRTVMSMLAGMILTRLLILPDDQTDEDEEVERTVELLLYGLSPDPRPDNK